MDDKFLQAFIEVVRNQISHHCDVELEGVGVLRMDHQKQYQQQYQDGRVVMMPPKDTIEFIPEGSN